MHVPNNLINIRWHGNTDLSVKIAQTKEELSALQKLRYKTFKEDLGAKFSESVETEQRDFDDFDDVCDQLMVVDNHSMQVVGTYRIMRRSCLPKGGQFYSEAEFDLTKMLAYFKGEIMEVGRACVALEYRSKQVISLLWRALGKYAKLHQVEAMFGCASLPGIDLTVNKQSINYLIKHHLAPEEVRPLSFKKWDFDNSEELEVNLKKTLASLPPLIKGYLRLGGVVGDGVFLDKKFNTTDLAIIVDVAKIDENYTNKFIL